MTHTITISKRSVVGDQVETQGVIDITSYTASGEVVTASEFGFPNKLFGIYTNGMSENGYLVGYDGKIRARGATVSAAKAAFTEVDAATDIGEIEFVARGV